MNKDRLIVLGILVLLPVFVLYEGLVTLWEWLTWGCPASLHEERMRRHGFTEAQIQLEREIRQADALRKAHDRAKRAQDGGAD